MARSKLILALMAATALVSSISAAPIEVIEVNDWHRIGPKHYKDPHPYPDNNTDEANINAPSLKYKDGMRIWCRPSGTGGYAHATGTPWPSGSMHKVYCPPFATGTGGAGYEGYMTGTRGHWNLKHHRSTGSLSAATETTQPISYPTDQSSSTESWQSTEAVATQYPATETVLSVTDVRQAVVTGYINTDMEQPSFVTVTRPPSETAMNQPSTATDTLRYTPESMPESTMAPGVQETTSTAPLQSESCATDTWLPTSTATRMLLSISTSMPQQYAYGAWQPSSTSTNMPMSTSSGSTAALQPVSTNTPQVYAPYSTWQSPSMSVSQAVSPEVPAAYATPSTWQSSSTGTNMPLSTSTAALPPTITYTPPAYTASTWQPPSTSMSQEVSTEMPPPVYSAPASQSASTCTDVWSSTSTLMLPSYSTGAWQQTYGPWSSMSLSASTAMTITTTSMAPWKTTYVMHNEDFNDEETD